MRSRTEFPDGKDRSVGIIIFIGNKTPPAFTTCFSPMCAVYTRIGIDAAFRILRIASVTSILSALSVSLSRYRTHASGDPK